MREAASRTLIADLTSAGAKVRAYDPAAAQQARKIFQGDNDVQIVDSAMAALEGADVLAIVTEWQEFRSPDFDTIRATLKTPAIFDGRNLYDPAVLKTWASSTTRSGGRHGKRLDTATHACWWSAT